MGLGFGGERDSYKKKNIYLYMGMCIKRGALSRMFGLGYASGVCFGV